MLLAVEEDVVGSGLVSARHVSFLSSSPRSMQLAWQTLLVCKAVAIEMYIVLFTCGLQPNF